MEMKPLILHHFSHRHPLQLSEIQENDEIICSGCEHELSSGGAAYICTKPTCHFILHDSCIELPRQIRHKSHPKHPLRLHFCPTYSDGEFTCDACSNSGHAFTYHCTSCKFDLHVECASLPEIDESLENHKHPLFLSFFSNEATGKGDDLMMVCDVCGVLIGKKCWAYVCSICKFSTHLECVGRKGHEVEETEDLIKV